MTEASATSTASAGDSAVAGFTLKLSHDFEFEVNGAKCKFYSVVSHFGEKSVSLTSVPAGEKPYAELVTSCTDKQSALELPQASDTTADGKIHGKEIGRASCRERV